VRHPLFFCFLLPHAEPLFVLLVPRSDFWAKNYTAVKAANAKLPILLRESNGVDAKLTATYGALALAVPFLSLVRAVFSEPPMLRAHRSEFGVEKTVSVEGMNADAFGKELKTLMQGS